MNSAHEWRTLIEALRSLPHGAPCRAALATIVRTRGSTFRRPGTRMLVFDDGRIVCELSGGCPQRDIVLRAQEAIVDGQPRMVSYNAESGLDVLMEMGCGGELDVLIEPLVAPRAIAFAEALATCLDQRRSVWLATAYATAGRVSVPRHRIWCGDRLHYDELGDDALAHAVAAAVAGRASTHPASLRLPARGGETDVLVEPVAPPHRLVVIGGNTAALALAPVTDLLGWHIVVVDQDPGRLHAERLPPGALAVCASPATVREAVALDAHTSVIVMTHNVEQDIAYLGALRDSPAAYIGALGSRERAERMRDDARFADVRQLHAPAGLDIGSETPTEIALSVAAEILAVVNRRSGGFLHDRSGTLHG